MKSIFESFIVELIHDVPIYVYEMLISIAIACIAIWLAVYKWEKAIMLSLKLLFGEYVFMTYCSTVFFRPRTDNTRYDLTLFWSYKEYYSGDNPELLPEIIMNIAGFIPLGFLMGAAFQKMRWWQVILVGFLISLSIESIQYFFKLGIAEFDDVFNNTLGVTIGAGLFSLTQLLLQKIRLNKI